MGIGPTLMSDVDLECSIDAVFFISTDLYPFSRSKLRLDETSVTLTAPRKGRNSTGTVSKRRKRKNEEASEMSERYRVK
jgi:hypothetical protein